MKGVLLKRNLSSEILSTIDELVLKTIKSNSQIDGVKPPVSEQQESYQSLCQKVGEWRGRPLFFEYMGTGRGNGPYVELQDGSVKLDFISGIGIHILGHSHPEVLKASISGALSDVVVQGNLQPNGEYGEILSRLLEVASRGSRIQHVWPTTCGAMAGENALKMARQKIQGARQIIAMENAFAGRSTMMAEITDNPAFRQGLPHYDEVLRIPFYDKNDPLSSQKAADRLKKHIQNHKGNICVFCLELMQGEGGYNMAPKEYFLPLLDLCRQEGIPIWFDEVQTFCRTGEFFAYQTLGLGEYADLVTVAKSLQVGATLYTSELNPKPGLVSGTFAGSSSALASGRAILDHLDQGNYMGAHGQITQIHKEFIEMLNALNEGSCQGQLHDAEGWGLMVGVTPLDGSREKMVQLTKILFKNGIIGFGCGRGPFKLRFLLPAILQPEHIKEAQKIFELSIQECL